MLLYILFCKQKTAYEMRISDWSSDVCSSDLYDDRQRIAYQRRINLGNHVDDLLHFKHHRINHAADRMPGVETHRHIQHARKHMLEQHAQQVSRQIGRASCRDRVCQTGKISGVAGPQKKKKLTRASAKL